jgi:hypothetical protein
MFIEELGRELVGRMLAIWKGFNEDGTPIDMPAEKQEQYRKMFRQPKKVECKKVRPSTLDIKQALWDAKFTDLFPEYKEEINSYLKNPGCACNNKLMTKIMKHPDRINSYYKR